MYTTDVSFPFSSFFLIISRSRMSQRRFEVTPVFETITERSACQPPTRSFSTYLRQKCFDTHRRASISVLSDTRSLMIIDPETNDIDDPDHYSSIQSNTSKGTNKFLQELRAKRRELQIKAKNFPIDQRIASHRRENPQPILRAQDIFAVHFQQNDDKYSLASNEENLFTEEFQDKVRNDIFKELNRQRMKEYQKQFRARLLARSLFLLMLIILTLMSCTLISGVFHFYHRADNLNMSFIETEHRLIDNTTTIFV